MQNIEITTKIIEVSGLSELSNIEQELVQDALDSAKKSYAPYSNFHVGASLLLENGKIIKGNNQENAAYPSGLCAERVAIFYANANYPEVKIKTMIIVALNRNGLTPKPVYPCGSCRQVMIENESRLKSNIKLILVGEKSIHILENASQLLPMGFDKSVLLGEPEE